MPAYVTLPGTSGNYFSTPDVNKLSADNAHLHQSIGQWTTAFGSSGVALSTDLTPVFGSNHGKWTTTATSDSGVWYGNNVVPISPGEVAYFTGYLAFASGNSTDPTAWTCNIRFYDSGGGQTSQTVINPAVTVSAGEWQLITHSATAPASTAYVAIRWGSNTGHSIGDTLYWDACTVAVDTAVTGFVRSLRIVNDIEIEWKVALDDYTPAATNTILDCLSTNDGYRIRHTTGDLIEVAYGNGSSTRAQTSSATGLTDGNDHVFKVTVDQSTGAVVYYIDGVQHDTDTMTTGAGQPDINDLVVGANAAASANWTDGDIYYVIVRDGIDGPVVARFDADDWVGV